MKATTVDLGGWKITMQRYPTSRSVVPSQNQRDQADAAELLAFARSIIVDHRARLERARNPIRGITDVAAIFQPKVPRCDHTDEEILAMAHRIHIRQQAALIREAVENDPAFFGANDPAFEAEQGPTGTP